MFDHDFKLDKVSTRDIKLSKRKFKLYKGFRKEKLNIFTDEQVASYF